jgi:predicted deacylase
MPDAGCYLIADDGGLYEALVDLNAEVNEGDPVGQIHFPERPERAPVIYRAGTSGTLIGRAHKVLVGPGDFLALIAHDH